MYMMCGLHKSPTVPNHSDRAPLSPLQWFIHGSLLLRRRPRPTKYCCGELEGVPAGNRDTTGVGIMALGHEFRRKNPGIPVWMPLLQTLASGGIHKAESVVLAIAATTLRLPEAL